MIFTNQIVLRFSGSIYVGLFFFGISTVFSQTTDPVQKLTEHIQNGQLVIYSESSYMSDTSARAITYVDFCPGGVYHYNYDGSFTVKGAAETSNRNNRGYGAGIASNSGKWQVLQYLGVYYLEIVDHYGKATYYPVDVHKLLEGKWKINNVSYLFAKGKGRCT